MDLSCHFVQLFGAGRLALSERPKVKELPGLLAEGCDRIVTILSINDKPQGIGRAAQALGIEWNWLQVAQASQLTAAEQNHFKAMGQTVYQAILKGESVLVHCSAGLHRTGMFAYALLRTQSLRHDSAMEMLGELRRETLEAFEEKYQRIAEKMI
ncbi:MAG TPA: hypothetical protein DCE41_08655 [Cytophagales bacterium]|nr:hypothetical protein [Cytophagales bacterium]